MYLYDGAVSFTYDDSFSSESVALCRDKSWYFTTFIHLFFLKFLIE